MSGLLAGSAAIEQYVPLVGSVFQNPKTQYFNVDTTAELAFPCENSGMPPTAIRQRVQEVVAQFHLEALMDRSVFKISGGEKQRIAIARAILKNAPILILDEATSAADPENQVEIDKAIENLCKGKTVIVVAHRLGALKMCNRVAVVENHTITSVGTHDEVRQDNAYYNQAWTDYETARNITYQLEGGADHA